MMDAEKKALRARWNARYRGVTPPRNMDTRPCEWCGETYAPRMARQRGCCEEHAYEINCCTRNVLRVERQAEERKAQKTDARKVTVVAVPIYSQERPAPKACAACPYIAPLGIHACRHPRLWVERFSQLPAWEARAAGHCPWGRT